MSPLLHLIFLVSGAVGLVYQVLWLRRFTLLFGATAPATVATLSAFFLGLGIGAAAIGARCPRWRRPLRAFAVLEVGVAVAALGVEPVLRGAEALLPSLTGMLPAGPVAALASRMFLAGLALVPAAALMGGTLPVLSQVVAARQGALGVRAGALYAVNTLGAAAGCLAVPLLLLPRLGASGSLAAAMLGSIGVALAALALDAVAHRPRDAGGPAPRSLRSGDPAPGSPSTLLLAASFLSGGIALALEVLWTRMLALVHENSVQSFATVVAVYLAATAAGAFLGKRLLARERAPRGLLAWGWISAGLLVVLTPSLFAALSSGLAYLPGSEGLAAHELRLARLALFTFFAPTLLAGLALPALMQRAAPRGTDAGPAMGRLLAANTLGAIAGPPAALLLPASGLGLWGSIVACGAVLVVAGGVAMRGGSRSRTAAGRTLALAALVTAVVLLRPDALPRVRTEPGERIVSVREGAFGTVAVVEQEDRRRLKLNNHYVLGGTVAGGEERLQGHLPLLLHPAPRSVAFLGLGTGITAGASLSHPVSEVVAMELIPEVIEAARVDFRKANRGLLDDPRVHAMVEDARVVLRASPGRFDVIVGDLAVPWRPGESSLYTLEAFQAARRALTPGGIFCQWVPMFQLTPREFHIIAATFLDVFPRTILWRGDFRAGEPAMALVGLTEEGPLDPDAVAARARDLAGRPDPSVPYLVHPAGVWVFLVGPLTPQIPGITELPRSLDNRPVVELESAGVHVSDPQGDRLTFTGERLRPFLDSILARKLDGTPLERLRPEHLAWRHAGSKIFEASLLSLAGRDPEADALAFEALDTLPEPIREAVLGH